MTKALRVLIEFHWGYSIKYPFFSASQPSFRYPPPTALIGALAYTIARNQGNEIYIEGSNFYSYVAELLDAIPWVAYRFKNIDPSCIVETRDISKVLIAPYVRSDNVYPASPYLWAVQTHGKIYAPSLIIEAIYIVRDGIAKKVARYAWGIPRIGTKESIVSIKSVELLDIEVASKNTVETSYSFSRTLAEPVKGSYMESRLPIPSREWYRLGVVRDVNPYLEDFVIPIDSVEAKLRERGVALRIGSLGIVIAPREVVEYD